MASTVYDPAELGELKRKAERALSDLPPLTRMQAEARLKATRRWTFCKSLIEPHIAEASNDSSAIGLLPNHEFLIRSAAKAQEIVKCRKTAHSWGNSLLALSTAATEPRSTTIIGSYDEDEAKEKNNFLKWQYKVLPPGVRRELKMSDGQEQRKFANGSRVRFIARKAPTGAGANILLDEFSVERPGSTSSAEMLIAALGATAHTGSVRLGGTERGPDTVFHKIRTRQFKDVFRDNPVFTKLIDQMWEIGEFPWWESPALSLDPVTAALEAPLLETEQRVEKFGNEKLQLQYALYLTTPELGIEAFQREFEMATMDDSESYFSFELIQRCYPRDNRNNPTKYWFEFEEVDGVNYGRYGDCLEDAKRKILALQRAIRSGELNGEWGFTMDIGRHSDQDEIWIGHTLREDPDTLALRLSIGMKDMPFPGKREIISYAMDNLPITRGYIDGTRGGLGVETAEWALKMYGQRCLTFIFSNETKTLICSGLKGRMQNGKFIAPEHPKFKKWENQILKLKKLVTNAGNVIFDIERNKNFHGDSFWASAMMSDLFGHPMDWTPRRTVILNQSGSAAHGMGRILIARN